MSLCDAACFSGRRRRAERGRGAAAARVARRQVTAAPRGLCRALAPAAAAAAAASAPAAAALPARMTRPRPAPDHPAYETCGPRVTPAPRTMLHGALRRSPRPGPVANEHRRGYQESSAFVCKIWWNLKSFMNLRSL